MDAVRISGLRHSYPKTDTEVLKGISLSVPERLIFGFLGPNGSGKTTLFKILSTLFVSTSGSVEVFGINTSRNPYEARKLIGTVFQFPSIDLKLTVDENLRHHGHLYGMRGEELNSRIDEQVERFGLLEKRAEFTGKLSGGQRRRVELAKGMIHSPKLLIMDEPSTGLDPSARLSLWETLCELKESSGVTILLTTHLITEAEKCDRLAILNKGEIIASGSPKKLKGEIGGDILTVSSHSPLEFISRYKEKYGGNPVQLNGKVRVEHENGYRLVPELVDAFPDLVDSITYGKPTLEDIFALRTGRSFWSGGADKNE